MDTRTRSDVPGPPPGTPNDARPLGELFRALSADAAALVRQEIALARAEVKQNVSTVARHAASILIGGLMAALGGLVLLGALVGFVGDLLGERYALGALLVGLLLAVGGGALAWFGLGKAKQASLAPDQAITSLRDTGEWARVEAAGLKAALAGQANGAGRVDRAGRPVRPRAVTRPGRPGAGAAEREADGSTDGTQAERERWEKAQAHPSPAQPVWKRVMKEFAADDLSNQAAKVAYYFFLSLPPAAMAIFGLTGFFGGQATGDWMTERLTTTLPGEASDLVSGFVNDVVHGNSPGPLSFGLLLALWAGSNVFSALEDTLNRVWGVPAQRSFVKKKAVSVGMLAGCAVLFLGGSAVLVGGGGIASALGLGEFGRVVWGIAQWPLGFALITATFWLIYYVLPIKDQSGCKLVLLKASAISAVLFVAASLAFRLYVTNFSSYSATYGILGTVIVLLLWMYVTSLVILLGGEIASEMERSA